MKILSRYILRESFIYFLVSLFAFTGILFVIRLLKLTSLIINKGVELSQVSMVFLAIIPTFLEIAIPLAALLGVMLAFARLSGDSEIIVMRASGISLRQLIRPVFLFGLLCGSACLFVSVYLKPWGYQELSKSLFRIARSRSTAGLTEGIFNELGQLTLYAEKIDHHTGDLQHVLIDDRRTKTDRKIISAQTGEILSDEAAQTITFNLRSGHIHQLRNKGYGLTEFQTNRITTTSDDLYDTDLQTRRRRSRELRRSELHDEIARTQAARAAPAQLEYKSFFDTEESWPLPRIQLELDKRLTRLELENARRYAVSFAAFVLALVAMPLGVQPPRAQQTWGAGLSATIGMLVFVFYYGILSICVALIESGILNPYVGVWIPNLIAGLAAYYMLRKMGSEKWQSVAHGVQELAQAFSRKFRWVTDS